MPRSQCENENVQFVQELAEVDGPFESPININYRDLTKLELPSLCWNRSDACPQKMKITNTGHTVIISGKWKCERPYLTGGPLIGKYVFSQIHFHWGQDECKGSEHQVSGEGFPLEMHVAHFKTDYLSQENALKEKDGMVVVAYLFKLQNEPNPALKKILSLLPCIKQPCTSQVFEPRPIMSLVNPFTDDYFMYWGSVITPTCAHILLWIICREPFGISREQVEEFRKIVDSSQHPICRNSRDIQPVHKRNVFHVNASRDLDNPLLPIKPMLGCYCRGSQENITVRSENFEAPPADCNCPVYFRNQEEIEGTVPDNRNDSMYSGHTGTLKWDSSPLRSPYLRQYVYVQNAIITPAPLLAKKIESEMIKKVHYPAGKVIKSEDSIRTNFVSQSCCFFSMEKLNQIKPRQERKKKRDESRPNSFGAISNILSSLEALKNQTFKKLKEIDAINQEIKGMELFCGSAEDKRWLRRIEKAVSTQKRSTIKKSQNCFDELKKLAKDCNFDKLFEQKQFPSRKNYQKVIQIKNDKNTDTNAASPCRDGYEKKAAVEEAVVYAPINQVTEFSLKAQKLVQSFFEDIKDTDDLQKTVRKNLLLKKIESNRETKGSDVVSKGFITQKMFTMENLGSRFFTEVTTSTEVDTEEEKDGEVIITVKESAESQESVEYEKQCKTKEAISVKPDSVIPLHKTIELSKLNEFSKSSEDFENYFTVTENQLPKCDIGSDTRTVSGNENWAKGCLRKKLKKKNTVMKPLENYLKKLSELSDESFQKELKTEDALASIWYSNSNFLSDSTGTQRMFIAKLHSKRSQGDVWKRKSLVAKRSSVKVFNKSHRKSKATNFSLAGYYLKKKKRSSSGNLTSSCDLSSTSRERRVVVNKSKWKRLTKAQLKLALEQSTDESSESAMECTVISPKRKKLKLDTKKKNMTRQKSGDTLTEDEAKRRTNNTGDTKEAAGQTTNHNEGVSEWGESLEKHREAITQTAESQVEVKPVRDQECESKAKILRTTSAGSRHDLEKLKTVEPPREDEKIAPLSKGIPKAPIKKFLAKNKSLTCLTTSPRFFPPETPLRLFVENINSRRNCSRDEFSLKRVKTSRTIENCKKPHELEPEIMGNVEKTVPEPQQDTTQTEVLPTAVKPGNDNPPQTGAQIQREKSKIPLVKRSDGQRYASSRRTRKEGGSGKQQTIEEVPEDNQRPESKNSSLNGEVKSQEEQTENNEVQTSVVLSSAKKIPGNKSFSAESLNSLNRPLKRRNKKRPHICKRSSKHYIRKNSLCIRKPNKVESKPFQRPVVPDEEQLKNLTHDVANYLRQTFVEYEHQPDAEKNIVKGIEVIMLKSLHSTQENSKKAPVREEEEKEGAAQAANKTERKMTQPKQETKPASPGAPKPPPRKPIHDFIKRNKLMAGKYRRGPSPAEKRTEGKAAELKVKRPSEKKSKSLLKEQKQTRANESRSISTKPDNFAGNSTDVKPKRTKIPKSLGKSEKTQEKRAAPSKAQADMNQAEEREPENESEMAVQKMVPANTRFLPAFMMTSYLPPPMEIVQNQQKQMNRYLFNGDAEGRGPGALKETLKKERSSDFLCPKDLEHLLTLQRRLHGEAPTGVDTSMNYVKTLLSQKCNATGVFSDALANEPFDYGEPLHYSDSRNSGIVLIEMSDFLDSSTSNSDLSGYFRHMDNLGQKLKNQIYLSTKAPQDSGDPGVHPIINHNSQEEWHFDSNYDCQIFITLSASANDAESGTPSQPSTTEDMSSGSQEVTNSVSTYLKGSSSQSLTLKQHRKKRKENEISAEMKQKLLEILETEIKREMGVELSVAASAEGEETCILEDSEGRRRSQSSASLDNMEVLTEISETMKLYLSNFKENALPRGTDETE